METLVEYLSYVKGIGYVLVVAFLFAFITFWMLVQTKNKDMIKNVPIVVILWLSFGAAALVSNGHVTNGDNGTLPEPESEIVKPVFPEFYSNGSPEL
ncbi:MAG: hypothetical protein O8C60_02310 [Candidatus Methanoperedens sp.]|nr:hypothetical protein [Candidatus Methanoperedens sp.]